MDFTHFKTKARNINMPASKSKCSKGMSGGWSFKEWLDRIWPSKTKLDAETIRELRDRTRACQSYYDRHWFYEPPADIDIRDLQSVPWDRQQCVQPYLVKKIRNGIKVSPMKKYSPARINEQRESPTRELTRLAPKRQSPRRPQFVQKPRDDVDVDPSRLQLDPKFVEELSKSPESQQEIMYQYFHGNVGSAYNPRHDWTRLPGHKDTDADLPPSSCNIGGAGQGSSIKIKLKLHQATVWTQMRAWVAQQNAGAFAGAFAGADASAALGFDARATPKGMLVVHSTGSGKTFLAAALMQAVWGQVKDDKPRPIMVFTTPENRDRIQKDKLNSEYWRGLQSMFPGSQLVRDGAAAYHARVQFLSFNQVGNRLGYGSSPKDADFESQVKDAFIILDEVQAIFTPLGQYARQNEGVRAWLDSAAADGTTLVLMTATPGKNVEELFEFLNMLRRANDRLVLSDYFDGNAVKRIDDFKARVAQQVSFVDFRNNTNDYPHLYTRVETAHMSDLQYKEWQVKAKSASNLENSVDLVSTEGAAARKYANMIGPRRAAEAKGKPASSVYASGDLDAIEALSAKLTKAVQNIEEAAETRRGKQYLYSAFNQHGIAQIAQVLEARGWTDVTAKVGLLGKARSSPKRLPGKPFRRFITTAHLALIGSRQSPRKSSPRRASSPRRSSPSKPPVASDNVEVSSRAELRQLAAFSEEFNAESNMYGEHIGLLLATAGHNVGLDLKAVRVMHVFEPLVSTAAETQTLGRGRRYCSHAALPLEDRNVEAIHYFSVEGTSQHDLVNSINERLRQAHEATVRQEALESRIAAIRAEVHAAVAQASRTLGGGGLWSDILGPMWKGLSGSRSQGRAQATASKDDVQTALLLEQHLAARAAALKARGQKVPMQLAVQLDLARERRKFVDGLVHETKDLRAQLQRIQRVAEKAKTPSEVRAAASAAQVKIVQLEKEQRLAIDESASAFSEAQAARAEALSLRKKLKPEFVELLDTYESWSWNEDLPKKPKRGKEEVPQVDTIATDILVHGISRREGKPMQDMLQALADAAFDCKVLQSLHARMGVAVTCAV